MALRRVIFNPGTADIRYESDRNKPKPELIDDDAMLYTPIGTKGEIIKGTIKIEIGTGLAKHTLLVDLAKHNFKYEHLAIFVFDAKIKNLRRVHFNRVDDKMNIYHGDDESGEYFIHSNEMLYTPIGPKHEFRLRHTINIEIGTGLAGYTLQDIFGDLTIEIFVFDPNFKAQPVKGGKPTYRNRISHTPHNQSSLLINTRRMKASPFCTRVTSKHNKIRKHKVKQTKYKRVR